MAHDDKQEFKVQPLLAALNPEDIKDAKFKIASALACQVQLADGRLIPICGLRLEELVDAPLEKIALAADINEVMALTTPLEDGMFQVRNGLFAQGFTDALCVIANSLPLSPLTDKLKAAQGRAAEPDKAAELNKAAKTSKDAAASKPTKSSTAAKPAKSTKTSKATKATSAAPKTTRARKTKEPKPE